MAQTNDGNPHTSDEQPGPSNVEIQLRKSQRLMEKHASCCKLCNNKDTDEMVACDKCSCWFHYKCVNVDHSISEKNWLCSVCIDLNRVDRLSTSSSSTSNREQLAALQEMERKLFEKRKVFEQARLAEQQEIEQMEFDLQQLKVRNELEGSNKSRSSKSSSTVKNVDNWLKDRKDLNNYPIPKMNVTFAKSEREQAKTCHDKPKVSCHDKPKVSDTRDVDPSKEQTMKLSLMQLASRQSLSKDLPKFEGDPLEWPIFLSNYKTSSVRCGFSEDENVLRLQNSIKGEARRKVRHLLWHPKSASAVIETLEMIYGRPDSMIANAMEEIRQHPKIKADDLHMLIDFSLLVQNTHALIEMSSLSAHLSNSVLIQEMIEKLPTGMQVEWAKVSDSCTAYDVSAFSEWLFEYARIFCKVVPIRLNNSTVNKKSQNPQKKSFGHHTHVESTDSTQQSSKPRSNSHESCGYCKENHKLVDCGKFKELVKNKRWDFITEHRLCRRCLEPHDFMRCKSRKKCGVDGCFRNHNHLLHNVKPDKAQNDKKGENANSENQQTVATTVSAKKNVLFRIIPVKLIGPEKSIDTFAFFDDGSSITLIEESVADDLGISGPKTDLCLRWTNDQTRTEVDSRTINIKISGANGKAHNLVGVRTVKSLNLPSQSIDVNEMTSEYNYLSDLPIKSLDRAVPRILIGIDNWRVSVPIKCREGAIDQPIATKSRLGWTVSGSSNVGKVESGSCYQYHICECEDDESLHQLVKSYFSVDNLGVCIPERSIETKENRRALEVMERTTKKIDGRYETGLIWRTDDVKFPSSYNMALRRLQCLETKMKREPLLAKQLCELINDYLSKGYARKLHSDEIAEGDLTWYLPVFTVKNINKPEKFRAVWDAAARVHGTSLNDHLLKGPDQLMSLVDILMRFRERKIAITGDIKEMYHQVQIKKTDQDAQRFLWREGDSSRPPEIYVMNVMTFGAACSPASAQFVKNINAIDHRDKYPNAYIAITANHYVDDWLQSVDTIEEAVKLIEEVSLVHSKAGFLIRGFRCNSKEVLAQVESTDGQRVQEMSEDDAGKVLGMAWCPKTDDFKYFVDFNRINKDVIMKNRAPTKREVLKLLMTIYDPLGLLASFLVYVKIILQEIWRSNVGWDDEILPAQYEKWKRWFDCLPLIEKIRIPRWCQMTSAVKEVQLHIFVDGSEGAYAAVAYLRLQTTNDIHLCLLGAKTKVTPLRPMSIPRVELQAALLGARFSETILKAHSIQIHSRIFWTDSETVLKWLFSDHLRYKQFVAYRLGEILELTDLMEWRWVGSKENVADKATKWKALPDLSASSQWFNGPPFLRKPPAEWPQSSFVNCSGSDEEVKQSTNRVYLHIPTTWNVIPDITRFCNWTRLKRTQSYVLRFANNLLAKVRGKERLVGPLTKDELDRGVEMILRYVQQESYSNEIRDLKTKNVVDPTSTIYNLSPFIDGHNLLRHRSRLPVEYGVSLGIQQPIILPRKHRVTELILLAKHNKYCHQNHETVMNEVRKEYYIPKLRTTYNKIKQSCQTCKVTRVKPVNPEMAPLPLSRLDRTFPFSKTGVDFFGPMEVVVGRRIEKRWGVIFTCLTVRAVHIEVAHSLSTDSCILVLRNFMNRRGPVNEIYSDNGTNFHGVNNEFNRLKDLASFDEFSGIRWFFNPPLSPHMGGAWERLIRSIKNSLKVILPTKRPTDEVLSSALTEVEMIINSRPLTFVSMDPDEMEALTPNHFLLGTSNGVKPLGDCSNEERDMRNSYKTAQYISKLFWKRWVNEYLPTITRRGKWFKDAPSVKIGDVVMIVYDMNIQNSWRRGVVVDVHKGRDDKIRSAVIKTTTGLLTRPVTRIAVMDVSGQNKDVKMDQS